MKFIETSSKGGVYWIRFSRPKAHNAISLTVMAELERALDECPADAKVCVFEPKPSSKGVVLSGGDLKEFHTLKTEHEAAAMAQRMLRIMEQWQTRDWITIGVFDGQLYGGGCELALIFDQVVISNKSAFHFSQMRFGLPPGWGGYTRLAERTSPTFAFHCYATQKEVKSEEAYTRGIVENIVGDSGFRSSSEAFVNQFTEIPEQALGALIHQAHRRFTPVYWQAIESERSAFAKAWADEAHHTRVQAFHEERQNR